MKISRYAILLVTILLLCESQDGFCQYTKAKYRTKVIKSAQRDSLSQIAQYQFEFTNINKIPYYQDAKILEQIDRLEKKKEWEKAYALLTSYVKNFGVQNFYRDTHLLWRLAKLVELLDDIEKAKYLYRLVLKHHRGDVKKGELYYDSLSKYDTD